MDIMMEEDTMTAKNVIHKSNPLLSDKLYINWNESVYRLNRLREYKNIKIYEIWDAKSNCYLCWERIMKVAQRLSIEL